MFIVGDSESVHRWAKITPSPGPMEGSPEGPLQVPTEDAAEGAAGGQEYVFRHILQSKCMINRPSLTLGLSA